MYIGCLKTAAKACPLLQCFSLQYSLLIAYVILSKCMVGVETTCYQLLMTAMNVFGEYHLSGQTNEICDVIVAHVYITQNFRLATFCYGSFSLLARAIDSALDPKN